MNVPNKMSFYYHGKPCLGFPSNNMIYMGPFISAKGNLRYEPTEAAAYPSKVTGAAKVVHQILS